MAIRPVFIPVPGSHPYVKALQVKFEWYSGFAIVQAQKSIASLHSAAAKIGFSPILEISSKSVDEIGVALSAFNLQLHLGRHETMSVECAYQGSKVFESGGPYIDLYTRTSREAKKDERLRSSGRLLAFRFQGEEFPTDPGTAFYDWLYIQALSQNRLLADQLAQYCAFSDIAFNPDVSQSCQARSAALYLGLLSSEHVDIGRLIEDRDYYLAVVRGQLTLNNPRKRVGEQLRLPFE
jgi:hypothetical protein